MLISLEGIDGAGKSTLCREISNSFNESVSFVSRKSYEGDSEFIKGIAVPLRGVLWNSGDSDDLPSEFWLYIQAAWHLLLTEQFQKYKYDERQIYLLDGWYYKFTSRLLVGDMDIEKILKAFENVIEPDIVILLKVDPESVSHRKYFRPTEQGLHDKNNYNELSKETFINYQQRTFDVLCQLQKVRKNWYIIDLVGMTLNDSVDVVAQEIASIQKNYY